MHKVSRKEREERRRTLQCRREGGMQSKFACFCDTIHNHLSNDMAPLQNILYLGFYGILLKGVHMSMEGGWGWKYVK